MLRAGRDADGVGGANLPGSGFCYLEDLLSFSETLLSAAVAPVVPLVFPAG